MEREQAAELATALACKLLSGTVDNLLAMPFSASFVLGSNITKDAPAEVIDSARQLLLLAVKEGFEKGFEHRMEHCKEHRKER